MGGVVQNVSVLVSPLRLRLLCDILALHNSGRTETAHAPPPSFYTRKFARLTHTSPEQRYEEVPALAGGGGDKYGSPELPLTGRTMERWSSLSTGQKAVAVTIGVSAGVAMLYVCYSRYRTGEGHPDYDYTCVYAPSYHLSVSPAPRHGEDELRMTIPRDAAHLIITEPVMAQCHAHIQVTPDGGGDRELIIKGTPEQVCQSQRLLHGVLQDGAALRAELHLPSRSIGRVMGHGGERIREIARSSGATIDCGRRTESSQTAPTRRITITGTQGQVEAAKTLLLKASEEEAAVQRRATECSTFRSRRKEIIAVKKPRPPENEDRQPQTPAEDRPSKGDSPGQENMADTVHNVYKFEGNPLSALLIG
ncbi:hypothetical protein GDO81_026057 [Engystomops pustulosus]|uniref:K Homology domain-containing protein n=1 Tax=Engystomops pustulosus TaxID=76066 RepID=A0AAV6YGJ1_ENGPU|nr:hypothetical protein GDO81_026057 [Engystomops pustulosus]